MKKKKKIIIDTDPGHDDALAILLLEQSNLFDIKAITTVAGNSSIQNTTNNARYILDLIESNTPIYSGSKKPLERELIQANVHGKSGLAGAKVTKTEPLNGKAVQSIIKIVRENPGEVVILTLGPLTNIAQAFGIDNELPELISELVMMGGAIEAPGNKNRVAEFNMFVDPEAAAIVFDSSVNKTLVPLDATDKIGFSINELKKITTPRLRSEILSMMSAYIERIRKFINTDTVLVYDALAAYYLLNKSAYTTELMDIVVETKGEHTRGMTVTDRRTFKTRHKNVQIVTDIDAIRFKNDFFAILNQT